MVLCLLRSEEQFLSNEGIEWMLFLLRLMDDTYEINLSDAILMSENFCIFLVLAFVFDVGLVHAYVIFLCLMSIFAVYMSLL